MDNIIDFLSKNGKSVGVMFAAGDEYYFEINLKNGEPFQMRTVNGKELSYISNFGKRFGKVIKEDGVYKFMNLKGDDSIIEVKADGFVEN